MSRAKIIAKWDECGSIARWITVSPFGFQAINCLKARRSTPYRSPNCCDADVDLVEGSDYCGGGVGVSAFPLPSCFFSPGCPAGICAPVGGGAFTPSALCLPRPSP